MCCETFKNTTKTQQKHTATQRETHVKHMRKNARIEFFVANQFAKRQTQCLKTFISV